MGVNYGRYGRFADIRAHGQRASGKSLAVTMRFVRKPVVLQPSRSLGQEPMLHFAAKVKIRLIEVFVRHLA
jgi:hypothetical protein